MRQSQQPVMQDVKDVLMSFLRHQVEEDVITAVVEALVRLASLSQKAEAAALAEMELFAQPRCNGRANYSSSDAYAGAYLYAVHSTGQECPLHGQPKSADGRIRKGVGSSKEVQEPVLQAMANYVAWREAQTATRDAKAACARLKMKVLELGAGKGRGW